MKIIRNKPPETTAVKIADLIGDLITFGAMFPQGVLGSLLGDVIALAIAVAKGLEPTAAGVVAGRISADFALGVSSFLGKFLLIRFANTYTFKQFGTLKYWQDMRPSNWSTPDVLKASVNGPFSVNGASIFAGITSLSFTNISTLLLGYKSKTLDQIAAIANSLGMKVPFMVASLIANFTFFPWLHGEVVKLLYRAFMYAIENPAYRSHRTEILCQMMAAMKYWKQINEEPNSLEKTRKISEFLAKFEDPNQDIDLTIKGLVEIGRTTARESGIVIPPESGLEFFVKNAVAMLATGTGIIGLYNFLVMTDLTDSLFQISFLAPVARIMTYISMSGMSLAFIYPAANEITGDVFFNRNYDVNLFSRTRNVLIGTLATIFCLLGAAPNAYQALIAGNPMFMIIFAVAASYLLEKFGFVKYFQSKFTASLSQSDPSIALAYDVSAGIKATINEVGPCWDHEVPASPEQPEGPKVSLLPDGYKTCDAQKNIIQRFSIWARGSNVSLGSDQGESARLLPAPSGSRG